MREIAIIRKHDGEFWDSSDLNYQLFMSVLITDFSTVTEETFELLKKASSDRFCDFIIVEKLHNDPTFIPKTVEDYVLFIKLQQEEKDRKNKENEEKRLSSKLKKLAKTQQEERELLAELLSRHPDIKAKSNSPGDE